MRALHRKLLRDLWHTKEQALAISVVMACGIATFVMALSMMDSLRAAVDTYYQRHRFADVFAHARRAPDSLAGRLREISGVIAVDTRTVKGALLDMPGMDEPASARMISLPTNQASALNLVHLRSGRLPEGRNRREVLVSHRFAEAHGLLPGDSVAAILDGRSEQLRIVGIALSPEFVYLIPPGGLLPQHDRYCVFWMGHEEMSAAFNMDGAFNDVLLQIMPGTSEATVIQRVDTLLARYGGLGSYGRSDQPSHQFITNELDELRGMTLIVPVVFLVVSAFLLHLVLGRLISLQREQIAALRALGYTTWEIGRHYLGFAMLIALVASILGLALGAMMGRGLTALYMDFMDFPGSIYMLRPPVALMALAIGPATGTLAVAGALRGAMRLSPAEAMRPPAPTSYRPTIVERVGLHRLLPVSLRMVVRYLERRPIKTALSAFGVALATAILVLGNATEDAVDHVLNLQFDRVLQRDVDLVFSDETDSSALASVRHLPGVLATEPYRSVGVRLRHGSATRRTGILGLERGDGMHHLLGQDGREVVLPDHGVVLSKILADFLRVKPGEQVTVEVLQGRRPVFDTIVAATIEDFSGLAAYMHLGELNRLMREPGVVGGVYIRVDDAKRSELYDEVARTPRIMAVNVTESTEQSFRETIAKNLGLMRTFLIGFSAAIAIGVIYNGARVSLSERGRDLASLRVLGFSRLEVATMQLAELTIITAVGVPLGLVGGYALAWFTTTATRSELVRMPFVIHSDTFAIAVVIVCMASCLSGIAIARRVLRLDLMAVLKARE